MYGFHMGDGIQSPNELVFQHILVAAQSIQKYDTRISLSTLNCFLVLHKPHCRWSRFELYGGKHSWADPE